MAEVSRRVLLLLGALAAGTNHAASGSAAKAPSPRACSASASLVALRLVDEKGAPVVGARVQVRRVSNQQSLAGTGPVADPGDYKILEGGDLPDLRAAGEAFDVEFQKDSRIRRVRVRIGLDADGCQAVLLDGPSRVVF